MGEEELLSVDAFVCLHWREEQFGISLGDQNSRLVIGRL